jgi:hypothetical protein
MSILKNKYPAKEHTQKVLSHLPKTDNAIIYLKGDYTKCRHNTDCVSRDQPPCILYSFNIIL